MKPRVVILTIAVLLFVWVGLALLVPANHNEERVLAKACQDRMKVIEKALRQFTIKNSDFPRDEEGLFTPDVLVCEFGDATPSCVHKKQSICTLHTSADEALWRGFVWCKTPTAEQINDFAMYHRDKDSYRVRPNDWIVMCHDENSVHVTGSKSVWIMLSTGNIVRYRIQGDEYRNWITTTFRHGHLNVPDFLKKQLIADYGFSE